MTPRRTYNKNADALIAVDADVAYANGSLFPESNFRSVHFMFYISG